MEDNTTYNLIDNRDNHSYTVAKLKDDNIWMVENLDLGRTALTIDLANANTNLSTTITVSTFNSWIKSSGTASISTAELIPITGKTQFRMHHMALFIIFVQPLPAPFVEPRELKMTMQNTASAQLVGVYQLEEIVQASSEISSRSSIGVSRTPKCAHR